MTQKIKSTVPIMPVIIALVAVFAVAVSPTVMAQSDIEEYHLQDGKSSKEMKGAKGSSSLFDVPEITGSLAVPEDRSEIYSLDTVDFLAAASDAQTAVNGGKVIKGGLNKVQGFVVYSFKITTADSAYSVIVDAGNGDVLYVSEGITFEDIEAKITEQKSNWQDRGDGKTGIMMKGDRAAKIQQKLLEPTGDPEIDALQAQFAEKINELNQAQEEENLNRIQELRTELQELRSQLYEIRSQ